MPLTWTSEQVVALAPDSAAAKAAWGECRGSGRSLPNPDRPLRASFPLLLPQPQVPLQTRPRADAQAPGVARLLGELRVIPASGEGWQERLLAEPGLRGRWLVIGQRAHEEDGLRVQRTWQWAVEHARAALVLDFALATDPGLLLLGVPGTTKGLEPSPGDALAGRTCTGPAGRYLNLGGEDEAEAC